ncbi:receptor-type guanylate cyclase gcy-21-like [Mya arenaria]|uniref:receptor-type guanylate cyclase gcy-21-like n=1 Tax=Mya arenaria TaxID=6604 RepID=UPI0022E283A9|nr:receptor-type guanylate cyclase gcy-21-like [Mya arenaria]
MLRALYLGRLIFHIQKERDMSTLYISKIGPGTKSFLIEEYDKTDNAFAEMWDWPLEFATNPSKNFRTKKKLLNYINAHRTALDPANSSVFNEIQFYMDIIDFLMEWMVDNIKDSGFGNTWKTLVVFQKITRCTLDSGAERAYGAMFYAHGNFPNDSFYEFYSRRLSRFIYNYRSATYYSDLVDPLLDERTDQKVYTESIRNLRYEVKRSNSNADYTSLEKAQAYFDNATFRIDYLYALQEKIANRVVRRINTTITKYTTDIAIYSVVAAVIVAVCPVIVFFLESLTSNMQSFSKTLVKASTNLNEEKSRTDSLIYQMLPKSVADRLKRNSKVDSEFFKSATVMFTSIVSFTQLSIEYTPMDLVELLNVLYTTMDSRLEKHDVYKVETINDTYMVVSGVPLPNGARHATEIAYLALDIVSMLKQQAIPVPRIKAPIQLLVGVSSGSVSAGVVGTVMLRYCLFGDTVNIASRMRSCGLPNMIHISDSTYINLKKTGNFTIKSRGCITVKGKGDMNTYWLVDAQQPRTGDSASDVWQLPGEADRMSLASPPDVANETRSENPRRYGKKAHRKFSSVRMGSGPREGGSWEIREEWASK